MLNNYLYDFLSHMLGKDKKEQPHNTYGIECRKPCEAVFYFSVSSSLNQEAYIRYPLAIF